MPMAAVSRVLAGRWWCMMGTADRVIRWSTALVVLGVAAITAVASYEHAYDLVWADGEAGWTAPLVPLTVDGLICASSMVGLRAPQDAGSDWPAGCWALGITATLAANVAHGLGAWPDRHGTGSRSVSVRPWLRRPRMKAGSSAAARLMGT